MRTLRRKIQLKDGVEVETLFTPHLFSYKDEKSMPLEANADDTFSLFEAYADIYDLAALNAWELDGKGLVDEFPFTRGDFHEYAAANPKVFAHDIEFAAQALTGKTVKELVASKEKGENKAVSDAPEGKKKVFRWIGRLLKRSS